MAKFGLVAFVASVVTLCGASKIPYEDEMDTLIEAFQRNLHHGLHRDMNRETTEHRRLAADRHLATAAKVQGQIPDINYGQICNGTCWRKVTEEFTEALKELDKTECKKAKNDEKALKVAKQKVDNKEKIKKVKEEKDKQKKEADDKKAAGGDAKGAEKAGDKKAGDKGGRRLGAKPKPVKQEAACIFDLCTKAPIQAMCANMTKIDSDYDMDSCKKANVVFLCKSICTANCTAEPDMRKLMCGETGKSGGKGGTFDSEAGGGGLKSMFNQMCSYNDVENKYCYDMIKADMATTKMDKGKGDTKFPNPCDAAKLCQDPMALALGKLGCCFPALMDAQKKYRIGGKGQVRMAKAIANACFKDTAFKSCTSGNMTKAKPVRIKMNTTVECDSLVDEDTEESFANTMADMLNLTEGDVQLIVCEKKDNKCARRLGEEDRRLTETGSETELDATLMGDDVDAQVAALEANLANAALMADLSATATEMAEVTAPTEAPTTDAGTSSGTSSGNTTTAPGGGLVASARNSYTSSMTVLAVAAFMLAY